MTDDPETIVRALSCWRGRVDIVPLSGGLSNASFKATDDSGAYVARVGRDFPFHHVSRRREAEASRAAHAAGLAPRVVYAADGVLVSDFIEGRTLTAADLAARVEEVVALVRRCHRDLPKFLRGEAGAFWVFHVARDYGETLSKGGHAIAPQLPRLLAIGEELEAAQAPLPLVFGHHDLLPANFIDDGARLWLIDWEYAGFGTPMFDLANFADNGHYDAPREARLLAAYFDGPPSTAIIRAFAAMKVASALRETLWACVSELYLSAPGADYARYAAQCLTKFEAALAAYRER